MHRRPLQLPRDIGEHAIGVTPPGGRIELRLTLEGDEAGIRVTDDRLPPGQAAEAEGLGAGAGMGGEIDESSPGDSSARERILDPLRIQGILERMGGRLIAEQVEGGPAMAYSV